MTAIRIWAFHSGCKKGDWKCRAKCMVPCSPACCEHGTCVMLLVIIGHIGPERRCRQAFLAEQVYLGVVGPAKADGGGLGHLGAADHYRVFYDGGLGLGQLAILARDG